jgi:hypothetical protein
MPLRIERITDLLWRPALSIEYRRQSGAFI